MKQNLVWFDIPALDIDRAIQFYSAVLARQIKKEDFGGVPTGLLPTSDGGHQGCVVVVKDFKPSADGIMIYLDVNGRLNDAVSAVRANGGVVQQDIHRPVWLSRGSAGFRGKLHRFALGDRGVTANERMLPLLSFHSTPLEAKRSIALRSMTPKRRADRNVGVTISNMSPVTTKFPLRSLILTWLLIGFPIFIS
jgi:predicted enzyme related to lactoylglutathione lyase